MSSQNNVSSQIADAIRSVVGEGRVPLHEPNFNGNEWLYLKECLDSTYVSSVGKFVDNFESGLVDFTGSKYAIAVVNGTAALHIALKLAGVEAGDEVLVPSMTFVATPNAISYCNAIPHFVDSESITLGIDPGRLREYLLENTMQSSGQCISIATGNVLRAMVVMHVFGHPSDIDALLAIGHDFNIAIIEDAAEAIGSYYFGRHTGTFGLFGTLSFNGNKTITTGGGGAILTNNEALARYAKHITTTAKLPHVWEFNHDEIGFNYRLPNLNAALGCAQLEQITSKLSAKRRLHDRYQNKFSKISGVKLLTEPLNCKSNFWLQTLLLDDTSGVTRDTVLRETNSAGLMTRPVWTLMHKLLPYQYCPKMDLNVSELLSKRLLNIPSSSGIID